MLEILFCFILDVTVLFITTLNVGIIVKNLCLYDRIEMVIKNRLTKTQPDFLGIQIIMMVSFL